MDYRRRVRVAFVDAMRAGFNSTLAAKAVDYGVPAFAIDFEPYSRNFVQAYVDPLAFESSNASIEPPGMVIYQTEAVDEKRQTNKAFSGFIAQHADVYLQYQALRDRVTSGNLVDQIQLDYEPEVFCDCVEAAFLETLVSPASLAIFSSVKISRTEYRADRDPITLTGDGMIQRVAITMGFIVHV